MADRGDTHYKTRTLNKWFALSSVLLLLSAFWMVIDDAQRPWKKYQREFQRIEVERARETLASAEAQTAMAEEERLSDALAAARARLQERNADLAAAEDELFALEGQQFTATEAEKLAKQVFNFEKFLIEEQRIHAGDPSLGADKIAELEANWMAANLEKLAIDKQVAAKRDEIKLLLAETEEVEREMKNATRDIDLVRVKLAQLDPDDAPTKIANLIRDFPGLDFIGPTLQVNKVVLEDLTFDLNFTTKKRIDMCHTCHVAIDRAGFEDLPQPYTSHPDLDLYLSAKSPHPMNQMGCTICHRGAGEALDFIRSDHRPTDEEEEAEWQEEYHWHKQHHWDYPMLTSGMTEASCVQCHKDSMELIAEDAPQVTEGYQLFERFGCYACHKVEWFQTKRRPGPTLAAVAQKVPREFVDAWVADPKAFRPTTWMPQIFHLENYSPETVISVSEYGKGRPIMGDEWSRAAVAAVSEFVWGRSAAEPLEPIPVEGDALRGKEVFTLVGCLACHNLEPFTEEERASIQADVDELRHSDIELSHIARGENEHGPNLRGVATKVSQEWLYHWLKNPTSYWAETRMPDLRLSDQEAADIVAYMFEDPDGVFHDTPEGWDAARSDYDREVLEEQARWFFNRTLPEELEQRFDGEWAEDSALLTAIGEKFVLQQGCHSCHEIDGLRDAQPIGVELTTWGSKTVDKLDWGLMHEFIAEGKGLHGDHAWHFKEQLKSYREPWLLQKLDAPRSFDREKFKNPTERLRMPWFDFTREQREAIATFVVGLVEDEVQRARMIPDPGELVRNDGLRAMRQKNCAACHVIEPGSIEFEDADGIHREIAGQFLAFEGETLPPKNDDIQRYVGRYEELIRFLDEDPEYEVEDVALQLLQPEPGIGEAGSLVVTENVASLRSKPAWGGDFVDLVTKYYLYATRYDENDEPISATGDPDGESRVQDVDGEWRNYEEEPYEKIRWTFAPPVLIDEGVKLQPDWFYEFLLAPYPLREQMRVRMPSFTYDEGEAGAIAGYFAHQANLTWPARFTRKFLLWAGVDPAPEKDGAEDGLGPLVAAIAEGGRGAISPEQVRAILDGDAVTTEANFSKLLDHAGDVGFATYGPNDPNYEAVAVRQPAVLEPILDAMPDFLERVHRLSAEGPNCFQCHYLQGEAPTAEGPIAWAPDLDNVRARLRPDWVREWLTDPSKIYPGTAMPANFPVDGDPQWQDLWPGASEEQIEVVTGWLFNLDRWAIRN